MEQTEQKDLFDIKLTASGKSYIRKFGAATRILIMVGILVSLIFIAGTIIRAVKVDPAIFASNKLLLFQHRIFPLYTAVYSILFFLQIYCYWKVSRDLSKGIDYNDEIKFNESFTALYRNAVFGITTLILSLLMNILDLYFLIEYYLK
jgi:hypothetical protein